MKIQIELDTENRQHVKVLADGEQLGLLQRVSLEVDAVAPTQLRIEQVVLLEGCSDRVHRGVERHS